MPNYFLVLEIKADYYKEKALADYVSKANKPANSQSVLENLMDDWNDYNVVKHAVLATAPCEMFVLDEEDHDEDEEEDDDLQEGGNENG